MRLIDADAWIEAHCEGCKYRENGICEKNDPICGSVELMNEAPTIDAALIVRCNFCKHYDAKYENCEFHSNPPGFFDPGLDVEMKPDDFCSYGERRSDGQA